MKMDKSKMISGNLKLKAGHAVAFDFDGGNS